MILAIQGGVLLLTFYLGFVIGQIVATKRATKMMESTIIESKQFKNK